MKKLIVSIMAMLVFCFVFDSISALAQTNRRPNTRTNTNTQKPQKPTGRSLKGSDKWFFGGDLGANFGNVFGSGGQTYVLIAPLVGYKITPKASAAAGPSYEYYRSTANGNDFGASIYGGRALATYDVVQGVFAHAELAASNFPSNTLPNYNGTENNRQWVTRFPIGGGYSQRLGGLARFNVTVLYDVLFDSETSPYGSPFIYRGGVTMGF